MKNIYPHFKPDKNLGKDLDTIRTQNHSTFNINYHLVWIPKYRRTLLADPRAKRILTEIIDGQCEDHKWKKLALEIMPDHVHLFLSVPPNQPISKVVNQIKGNSSIQLRRVFPELKARVRMHLWGRGYYCSTAGFVSQAQVQKYIDAQQRQMWIKRNRKVSAQVPKKEPQRRLTHAEIPPTAKAVGFLSVA